MQFGRNEVFLWLATALLSLYSTETGTVHVRSTDYGSCSMCSRQELWMCHVFKTLRLFSIWHSCLILLHFGRSELAGTSIDLPRRTREPRIGGSHSCTAATALYNKPAYSFIHQNYVIGNLTTCTKGEDGAAHVHRLPGWSEDSTSTTRGWPPVQTCSDHRGKCRHRGSCCIAAGVPARDHANADWQKCGSPGSSRGGMQGAGRTRRLARWVVQCVFYYHETAGLDAASKLVVSQCTSAAGGICLCICM